MVGFFVALWLSDGEVWWWWKGGKEDTAVTMILLLVLFHFQFSPARSVYHPLTVIMYRAQPSLRGIYKNLNICRVFIVLSINNRVA